MHNNDGDGRQDKALGPRARLRAHFLAKAAKCHRAADLVQHPRAKSGYKQTAQRWEAMAKEVEAADASEISEAEIPLIGL